MPRRTVPPSSFARRPFVSRRLVRLPEELHYGNPLPDRPGSARNHHPRPDAPLHWRSGALGDDGEHSNSAAPCRAPSIRRADVIVDSDYRGFRIEVTAQHVDGAWDVEDRPSW